MVIFLGITFAGWACKGEGMTQVGTIYKNLKVTCLNIMEKVFYKS